MHKDATSRKIEEGSYIAYTATGRRGRMEFGIVTKLKEVEYDDRVYDSVTRASSYVKKIKYSIQFICAQKDYKTNGWTVKGKREGKRARHNHLDRLDRVIILDANQLDPEVRDALDREMAT